MSNGATVLPFSPTTAVAPWLVFSDDWGRHPSSCQHLIRALLPRQKVTWVNMIGTRRPRFDVATARRGVENLGQWLRFAPESEALPANLRVVSPRVWPGFGNRLERSLNRGLLVRQLRPLVDAMPQMPIAVTTMPTAADLIGVLPVARWVYYCVDDFSVWPGIDRAAARRLEDKLIDEADVVIAVSEALCERVSQRGGRATLLTHGVDLDFWGRPLGVGGIGETSEARLGLFKQPDSPLILFWGLIDRRMDVSFIRALADALPSGRIAFVGPEDNPDPGLWSLPGVVRLPAQPLAALPALAASASVLIMPYADLPVTRAMQPLKLKEYLATGRPAVVRDLPENRAWSDCLDLAATPEEFAAVVLRRLDGRLPETQRRARRRLIHESWTSKARLLAELTAPTMRVAA